MNGNINSYITMENGTQIVQIHENHHENNGTQAILSYAIHTNPTYGWLSRPMVGAEPDQIQIVTALPTHRGSSDDEATLFSPMLSNSVSSDVLLSQSQNQNSIMEEALSNTSLDPVPLSELITAPSDDYDFLNTPDGEYYVFESLNPFVEPHEQALVHTRVQELEPPNGYRDINRFVYEADAIPLPSTNSFDETSNNIHILIKTNIIRFYG